MGGMREELLDAARAHRTVLYGQLMKHYRLSRGRALSRAIGLIDRRECDEGAPGFAAIIVRKDTGLPGGGSFLDLDLPSDLVRSPDRRNDPRLSRKEQNYVRVQQHRIWRYYSRDRKSSAAD